MFRLEGSEQFATDEGHGFFGKILDKLGIGNTGEVGTSGATPGPTSHQQCNAKVRERLQAHRNECVFHRGFVY